MKALSLCALVALVAAVPLSAPAQVVADCDWIASPANIAEPWDQNSRTYANGAIRVALLDTGGEPVCCAAHLLILMPSGDQDGPVYRQCRVASAAPGTGFFSIDVPGIAASYDPGKGLLLSIPVGHWHAGMESGQPAIAERMEIRLNQASGEVRFE